MSQIIQIIEMEQQRAEDNRAVIHLHKDGAFWRAYNWSAVPLYVIRHNNDRAADEGEENENKALRTLTDVHDALFFCSVIQKESTCT